MMRWFVYIVFLLVFAPCLLLAGKKNAFRERVVFSEVDKTAGLLAYTQADTIKVLKTSAKPENKVKEVAKAKRQPKPEKVDDAPGAVKAKEKPKRQRRPDGMERPPEIPRRNDN